MLDAGCGEGMHVLPVAPRFPAFKFFGLDKNKNHIDFCTKYSKTENVPNVLFVCHNITEKLPVQEINILLCIGTLQYVRNDVKALCNFYNSMKSNGLAIIYTPINGQTILPVYRYFFDKKKHYEKSQNRERIYSAGEIISKLESAGFRIIEKEFTYGKIGVVAHEIYSLLLMGLSNSSVFSVIFVMLLIFFLPLILIFNFLDSLFVKGNGNGLLIIAQK